MQVNNVQQQTSFKANTIVRFETKIKNMDGYARVFAELAGHIPHGQSGKTFFLNEDNGLAVLVPDTSTESGNALVTAFYDAYKYFQPRSETLKQHLNRVFGDIEFQKKFNGILNDKATLRVQYKDNFPDK